MGKKEELDQQLFKLSALEGMADFEMETISHLAFLLKYRSTEIKATKDLLLDREYEIYANFNSPKEIVVSEEALFQKKKVKKMRRRDLITYKLKNNLELTIPEKRMWEKKTTSHIWSQCPNLKECVNAHCWRTHTVKENEDQVEQNSF